MLPIFIVTHVVGLGIEFWFAAKKGHAIEEGFLVSGALIPLIMPPDIPLWILGMSVAFAVIFGKEAFGGTGMNIWNIALLSRVFVFFAYPGEISGDTCWVAGYEKLAPGDMAQYGWWHTGFFNTIFGWFDWSLFDAARTVVVDGYSGATPLALGAAGGYEAITAKYSMSQIFWGDLPGSIGETCKPLIIMGALFLLFIRIASWRIMLSMLIGASLTGMLFNSWEATIFMNVPWYDHLIMGSFLFAMAFMATDPVTASNTNKGKWIYGFFIGVLGMIIRIMNPAYPEGWMLAILFMNACAPLIDYFIVQSNIKRRLKYVQQ
jgi:Na+-transporting NADH:ubiquinone oxidoreductase subunit B